MKAGILAAGTGSRFLQAGWDEPKPLVRLADRPIIHHVLDNLFQAGVESVEVLLNGHERFDPVEDYLRGLPGAEQRIRVSRKITRSSFETFSCLLKQMGPPPFVLSTVDSILDRRDLERFLQPESYPPECALALAVTDYVNDEKPLWVEFDPTGKISCIGEGVSEKRYVTAGIYFVLKDLSETAVGEESEAGEVEAVDSHARSSASSATTSSRLASSCSASCSAVPILVGSTGDPSAVRASAPSFLVRSAKAPS